MHNPCSKSGFHDNFKPSYNYMDLLPRTIIGCSVLAHILECQSSNHNFHMGSEWCQGIIGLRCPLTKSHDHKKSKVPWKSSKGCTMGNRNFNFVIHGLSSLVSSKSGLCLELATYVQVRVFVMTISYFYESMAICF